ncbi:MAG TPA: hydroxymethylbilane synthase [Acidimicrobiales bacterium]|nr:hydroxymethylbilane synthase [Acidimicrobiales bacterium]
MLRAATRGSELALWQTGHVAALLGDDVEPVVITTAGDRDRERPIEQMGGQGVFVKEVQDALLDGRADIAVHSAKDLQSTATPGLVIGAFPERGDARDALVGSTLDGLAAGAIVGTGSVRRRAQLAGLRPDLSFGPLRGNIATRLEKAAGFSAIFVAAAALERLGLSHRATEILDPSVLVPQVGQGALAVECRSDDEATRARLGAIDHRPTRRAVEAERAFLAGLGGGCDLPVGAHAVDAGDGRLRLTGLLASPDGRVVLRVTDTGDDPVALGAVVLERLLDQGGGRALLDEAEASP